MEHSNTLKRWLTDLTATYHDEGDKVEVKLTDPRDGSYAAKDSSHIGVNTLVAETFGVAIDRANELRIISDTTSHEVEHVNESVLTHKSDFMDEYPMADEAAGTIQNVLEDVFIDRTRTEKKRGLRKAHAYKIDTIMANDEARPPVNTLPKGADFVEGFLQVAFAGAAKGVDELDPADNEDHADLVEWLNWVKPWIDAARHTESPAGRYQIAHVVMRKLLEYIPEEEARKAANEHASGAADGNTTDKTGEGSGNPEDWDKEDIEEYLKGLTQEDVDAMEPPENPEDGVEVDIGELDLDEDDLDFDPNTLPKAPAGQPSAGGDEDDEAGEEGEDGPESAGGDEDGQEDTDGDEGREDGESGPTEDESGEDEAEGDEDEEGHLPDSGGDAGQGDAEDTEGVTWEGKSAEWHGLTQDEDYHTPGEMWERRAERIDRDAAAENTDMGQMRLERDERIDNAGKARTQMSQRVRETLRDTGLAQDIVDAFRRLRTRDVKIPVTQGEEIHVDNAIQHLSGDYTVQNVYQRTQRIETGDRAVAVACDFSGSMRILSALTAMAGVYIATREIGDTFAGVGFHGSNQTPLVKTFGETWEWELVDGLTSGGSTPMPAGIATALALFEEARNRERVLIVITDGMANTSLEGGDPAEESAGLVQEAQLEGIKVIGLGVGGVNDEYMRRIFGSDGYVLADSSTLAERLVQIYWEQMDLVREGRV